DFGIVTAPRPVVTPSETTTYYLSVSNGQCDPINRSVTIEVVGEVTVDVEASRDRICEGESVELKANITGGSSQDNFVWVNDRGLTFEGQNITVFPPQTTTYTLNYTSGGDCQQIQRSVTITVDPGVDVTIKTDAPATILPQGSVVNLEAMVVSNALGNIQINWTGNGVNLGSGEAISTTLIENPASFEVTAATPAGCTDADTIVFEIIQPSIEIPNAFTPNGDGNNDYFNVLYSGQIDEILEFQIRNRWGKLVYNNENQLEGWDGNLNGKPQPTEVYVYLLKIKLLDGELVQRQGDVTLIR
ncbi:MAG: gliding motility-associated C-terminal domain-containing protein, partial [Saprospiraceae bacterium]